MNAMKKIYLLAYFTIILFCLTGCDKEEMVVLTIPSTTVTPTGSGVEVTSMLKYTPANSGNRPTIESYGAYVSATDPKVEKERLVYIEGHAGGTLTNFTISLSGLEPDTRYYIKTFVRNIYGEVTGEVVTATTYSSVNVTTYSATEVTDTGAKLSGYITSTNGKNNFNITQRGFVLSTASSSPTLENNTLKLTVSGTTGSYSYTCTTLTNGTKYYFRAYAIVNGEPVYGATKNFTTMVLDNVIAVTLTSIPSNTITDHSFNVRGTISIGKDAVGTIKEVGFVCATHATPTLSNERSIMYWQAGISNDDYGDLATWSGLKNLVSAFTALSSNTTYYCRMYYTLNNGQTVYSSSMSVTTAGGTTTGGKLTIAQFKNKPDDVNTWYELTGVIYRIDNTQYGNFYLADETGLLPIYGLTATQKTANDQSFASLGLKAGDYITIKTPKITYGGAPEGKNAYLVSKNTPLEYSTSFTTYALEPASTSSIALDNPIVTAVFVEEHKQTYDYTYATINIRDGIHRLRLAVRFFDFHDAETVIPQGTYTVKQTMMGSVWGGNGVEKSSGYKAYINLDEETCYEFNSTSFGFSCPYYVTGGSLTVSKSGTNTRLQINLTTYYGSTIKGDITDDLLSKMTLFTY